MGQKISVIGAVSSNGVYGEGEKIPWYIPEDFKNFKQLTTEWSVIMGRGTWESLPPKFRPLPHRQNLVVTNTPHYQARGAIVCASIEQAIAQASTENVFCIGGINIWYHAMQFADEAWITIVKKEYPITGITRCARELLNPPSTWPAFSFNELVMDKNAEGDIPGFSIVHWISTKRK